MYNIEKEQVIQLINHIKQGLQKFTLEELNEKINGVVTDKELKQKEKEKQISIILEAICNEYSISKHQLIYSKERGDIQQAKMIAYCLLHIELGLPIRYIAEKTFFLKWHNSVWVAIKYHNTLDLSIRPDREFKDKLEKIKSTYLQKNKKNKV